MSFLSEFQKTRRKSTLRSSKSVKTDGIAAQLGRNVVLSNLYTVSYFRELPELKKLFLRRLFEFLKKHIEKPLGS